MSVNLQQGQLDITVSSPQEFMNKTNGLLGVFNGDPSDDLLPFNQSQALDSNSTEKLIFNNFGTSCKYYWLGLVPNSLFSC